MHFGGRGGTPSKNKNINCTQLLNILRAFKTLSEGTAQLLTSGRQKKTSSTLQI